MVHLRLNERESNPNPHINFISVLDAEEEDARSLIRALAAQVKPVMKTHGFTVNSLEEYEHNKVFAGRNWNNGETVELVLRSAGGSFLPTSWLMNTLCHELAHIKHMNHGPEFQNLWKQLRNEVLALQNKGYYGDGYWSAGIRLADSSKVTGQGIEFGEFPEYMCGGAQKRTRPSSLHRRRGNRAKVIGPSLHSGRQTAKKRKAGIRVTSKYAFAGEGKALNEDLDEDQKKKGIGFRKQASSKRAREERALAAERRIMALQSQAAAASSSVQASSDNDSTTESDDSDEDMHVEETDQDRRKAMLDASQDIDLDNFKYDFPNDFDFNLPHLGSAQGACDLLTSGNEGSTFTNAGPSRDNSKDKARHQDEAESSRPLKRVKAISDSPSRKLPAKFGFGNLVQDEVQLRKKESIGLALSGNRWLGSSSNNSRTAKADEGNAEGEEAEPWECFMCTLINKPRHLACSACATPRSESSMGGKV